MCVFNWLLTRLKKKSVNLILSSKKKERIKRIAPDLEHNTEETWRLNLFELILYISSIFNKFFSTTFITQFCITLSVYFSIFVFFSYTFDFAISEFHLFSFHAHNVYMIFFRSHPFDIDYNNMCNIIRISIIHIHALVSIEYRFAGFFQTKLLRKKPTTFVP